MNKKICGMKTDITKLLMKKYKREFEDEGKDKSKSTLSLINAFEKFTNEFIEQSKNYVKSFEQHSKTIIEQYDTKKNNVSINHINFIVIGPAGVGKSSFINQSLLLEKNKRALEGIGESVTNESHLYTSEKLTMIRMWDTQGLDFKRNPETILNEIKNLVNNGLKKGPDYYINIILYCTNLNRNRFQEEEGKLIKKIMELYPSDNLPVIITQLQAYFPEDAKDMEKVIREILRKYLEEHIVSKIEIKSLVARKKETHGTVIKAYGVPELLKCSFDKMGQAITSATSKKFSQEIEGMCKKFVEDKLIFIDKIFKDEFELLNKLKNSVNLEEEEDHFQDQPKKINYNNYNNYYYNYYNVYMNDNYNFVENFLNIVNNKFKQVYNNLNGNINNNQDNYMNVYIENKMKSIKTNLQTFCLKSFNAYNTSKISEYYHELLMKQVD